MVCSGKMWCEVDKSPKGSFSWYVDANYIIGAPPSAAQYNPPVGRGSTPGANPACICVRVLPAAMPLSVPCPLGAKTHAPFICDLPLEGSLKPAYRRDAAVRPVQPTPAEVRTRRDREGELISTP